MSYINAFCRSCIPIQLINWVTNQNCVGRKITRPNVSTPIALISEFLSSSDILFAIFYFVFFFSLHHEETVINSWKRLHSISNFISIIGDWIRIIFNWNKLPICVCFVCEIFLFCFLLHLIVSDFHYQSGLLLLRNKELQFLLVKLPSR